MALSGFTELANVASGTDATSYSTASVSPTANAGLLLAVMSSDSTVPPAEPTISQGFNISGSWSKRLDIADGSVGMRITVWAATASSSPGSGTATADFGADSQTGCFLSLIQFAGQAATFYNTNSDTDDEATGTTASVTLPNALANAESAIISFVGINASDAISPTGGETELSDTTHGSPTRRFQVQYEINDTTSSVSWTNSTGGIIAAAMEILAAAGGGQTVEVGLATQTNTSQSVAALHIANVGQVAVTDTTQALTIARTVQLGQTSEIETIQSIIVEATGEAAGPLVYLFGDEPGSIVATIDQVTVTETVFPIVALGKTAVSQVSETETVQAITILRTVPVGLVTQTNTSQAITLQRVQPVGLVTVIEQPQAITVPQAATILGSWNYLVFLKRRKGI